MRRRSRSAWNASGSTRSWPYAKRRAAAARRCSPISARATRAVRQLRSLHRRRRVFDGTIEAQKLLSAIVRTGERFGTEHIISILMGDETDAILRLRHQGLKTFGIGKDRSKTEWRSLLRQIYALGLITLELSEYGRWTITERGVAVLKGRERVELRADVLMKPRERRRKARRDGGQVRHSQRRSAAGRAEGVFALVWPRRRRCPPM